MKLQKLLDYSPDHPAASDAALAIIRATIPKPLQEKNLEDNSISNLFLQTIYKCNRYTSRTIPKEIHKTPNTGTKYNLCLDAPILSQKHKTKLPAWHHIGKTPGMRNHEYNTHMRCLRTHHNVETVGELVIQETLLENMAHNTKSKNCECQPCKIYRAVGCTHPNACFNEVV